MTSQHTRRLASFLLAASVCLAADAVADLSKSQLTDLIAESELILQAEVVRTEITGPGKAGQAVLKVKSIHRGVFPKAEITIRWSSEVHDQRIDRVGENRLLFLKRGTAGEFEGTQYGRSYWVVHQGTYGRLFTPYSYPTTKIVVDVPNLLHSATTVAPDTKLLDDAFGVQCQAAQVIYLDDVLALIKARSH